MLKESLIKRFIWSWFGIFSGYKVYSGVGYELGEVVELEVGGEFVSINISNMKSMWIFMTMHVEMLIE